MSSKLANFASILEDQTRAQAEQIAPKWRMHLGSLGSGNHFIEVSLDEQDRVWLFLHSGSRGVGNKLAQKHIAIAREQCERRWIRLPDPDLAYLVEGEPEFDEYLSALRWAQRFAFLNREEMMDRVVTCRLAVLVAARRGTQLLALGGPAAVHPGRSRRADGRHRVG